MNLDSVDKVTELINERKKLQELTEKLETAYNSVGVRDRNSRYKYFPILTMHLHFADDEKRKVGICDDGLQEAMIAAGQAYVKKALEKVEKELEAI